MARTLLEKVFMDDLTLKIDTGAPVEVPAFEPDECGHNWLAVIEDCAADSSPALACPSTT